MTNSIAVPAGRALPSLAESRPLRFIAIVLLYFMQGVPLGLTLIAIPAWLAASGASPIAVGGFVGTALLPWSLKLVNGLLMDRFAYRPMGRRRGWILVAQTMMVATLIALSFAAPSAQQVGMLAAFCFVLNVCATFNDVAVDGMTIDIVPESERTAINGFMFGAQALGIAATGFIAGQMLVSGDIAVTALLLSGFVAIASTFVSSFRERPGERLMPWTSGQPSAECEALQQDAWWPILTGVFRSLASSLTVLFLLATALSQASFAFTDAVGPTLAVQRLGWGSDGYSNFASAISVIAALIGASITALIVRAIGLRMVVITLFLTLVAMGLVGGMTYPAWQDDSVFQALFAVQYVAATLLQIVTIVWAMRICNPAVAASQFAFFMAVPNFGRSLMSGASGWVVESGGYVAAYYAVAAISIVGMALAILAKVGRESALKNIQ